MAILSSRTVRTAVMHVGFSLETKLTLHSYRFAAALSRTFRRFHDYHVASRLLWWNGQGLVVVQVIRQVTVKGVERRGGQHEVLFMNDISCFAPEDAEIGQRLRRSETLFDQIPRPAPRLDRFLAPMANNSSTLTQDIPLGLESCRNI